MQMEHSNLGALPSPKLSVYHFLVIFFDVGNNAFQVIEDQRLHVIRT